MGILRRLLPSSRSWWVLDPGMPWEQWARLKSDGKCSFYDAHGEPILRTHYGNRVRAVNSLKSRRFRKLSAREIEELQPPGSIKQDGDGDEESTGGKADPQPRLRHGATLGNA